MLQELGWDTLEDRRSKSRLILLYEITHKLVAIPSDWLIPSYTYTRSNHIYKYQQIYTRTQFYQFSFFPRTIREWNKLQASVAEVPSFLAFKQTLTEVPVSSDLP